MAPSNGREKIAPSGPISYIHLTGDGPVHLLVRPSKGGWVSIHWSKHLAGGWTFKTMEEANENVLHRFETLYADHICSEGCGPAGGIALHESDDFWGMIPEEDRVHLP